MNTKYLLGSVGIACATILTGSALAEVTTRDGADQFADFRSSITRADVRSEFARSNGEGTSVSMRDGEDAKAPGARGVAGSRYSGLTREEIRTELANSRRQAPGDRLGSIYFGD